MKKELCIFLLFCKLLNTKDLSYFGKFKFIEYSRVIAN